MRVALVCCCGRIDGRGQALPHSQCCGRWQQASDVPDAESLMRSRYSAFVRGDVPWLHATWHPDTRPPDLTLEAGVRWLGLDVRAHRLIDAQHAEVEFVARSRWQGRGQRLHECSRFVFEAGQWWYVEGTLR